MQEVKRKYVKAESDTKTEAIERKETNNSVNEKFDSIQRGDSVQYFRRGVKSEEQSRGPATGIGKNGTIVILRHDSRIINSHMRDVRKFLNETSDQKKNLWEREKNEKQMMTNETENCANFGQTFRN